MVGVTNSLCHTGVLSVWYVCAHQGVRVGVHFEDDVPGLHDGLPGCHPGIVRPDGAAEPNVCLHTQLPSCNRH